MNCSSIHTWFSFQSFYIGVKSYLWKTIVLLAFVIAAFGSIVALARDDTIPGLERPEWQAHADLKFRNACQSALQKLCLELVQIYQRDPSLPANSDLLVDVANLLESTDGKLPKKLPDHPASIDYVKARKAAVIEWNKVYKSKGRDLPTAALEAEKKFQEAFRDPTAVLPTQMSNDASSLPASSENKMNYDDVAPAVDPNSDDKKTDNKASEATIKNLVNLIRAVNKYTNGSGETTAEKQASALVLKRAAYALVEKQPLCFLTFPIKDVAANDEGLVFTVDTPVEFEQIQKALGREFLLASKTRTIHTKQLSIMRKLKSIKPGDWLRVRFEVGVAGLNTDGNASGRKLNYDEHQIKFNVMVFTIEQKTTADDGTGQKQQIASSLDFVDKTIVELLVVKPQAKAVAP